MGNAASTSMGKAPRFSPLTAILVILLTACGGGGAGSLESQLCNGVTLPISSPKSSFLKAISSAIPITEPLPIKAEGMIRPELLDYYPEGFTADAISADGFLPALHTLTASLSGQLLKPQRGSRAVGTAVACQNLDLGSDINADGLPFTISGNIRYQDHIVSNIGFSGATTDLPVQGATMDLVRCEGGAVLGQTQTDQNGDYSITAVNPATNESGTPLSAGVYIRVLAEAVTTDANVQVTDTTNALYAVSHEAVDERTGSTFSNQDIFAADADVDGDGIIDVRAGAPFNILDITSNGIDFVRTQLGIPSPLADLRVIWEHNITAATVFMPGISPTITLASLPDAVVPDTDEYDDSVIMHEVGHFVADQVSRDNSPGGTHTLNDSTQDARLSWSEGWGNFYAGAASGQSLYRDTGGAGLLIGFDLETLRDPRTGGFRSGTGTTNELAVAGTLWDALDSPSSDQDQDFSDLGPGPIMTALADLIDGSTDPVTFGRFAHKLQANMQAQESANFTQAAALQGIDLSLDSGTDDTLAGATFLPTPLPGGRTVTNGNLTSVQGGNDEDHFAVTLKGGERYAICTYNLSDGADTALELIRSGNILPTFSNDNFDNQTYSSGCFFGCPANTATTLASTINNLNSATDTDYVIRVKRSDIAPPSTGLFGQYGLMITTLP
jgi:hypothetical protein